MDALSRASCSPAPAPSRPQTKGTLHQGHQRHGKERSPQPLLRGDPSVQPLSVQPLSIQSLSVQPVPAHSVQSRQASSTHPFLRTSFLATSSSTLSLPTLPSCTLSFPTLTLPSPPSRAFPLTSKSSASRRSTTSFPRARAAATLEEERPFSQSQPQPQSQSQSQAQSQPRSQSQSRSQSQPRPRPQLLGDGICLVDACDLAQSQVSAPQGAAAPGLLVYFAGMDCTGEGVLDQLPALQAAGFEVKCLRIPTSDRSSWAQLADAAVRLLREEQRGQPPRPLTLLAESFGACLALRVASRAPRMLHRLVLINPATNFPRSSPIISFGAATGILSYVPTPVFRFAQDLASTLLVKRASGGGTPRSAEGGPVRSPIYSIPAECAAWRCAMLNDMSGLGEGSLRGIRNPTLLVASAEDLLFPSVEECARLQSLLPNATRTILATSGHTPLLEEDVDIARVLRLHGFVPASAPARAGALSGQAQAQAPLVGSGSRERGGGGKGLARGEAQGGRQAGSAQGSLAEAAAKGAATAASTAASTVSTAAAQAAAEFQSLAAAELQSLAAAELQSLAAAELQSLASAELQSLAPVLALAAGGEETQTQALLQRGETSMMADNMSMLGGGGAASGNSPGEFAKGRAGAGVGVGSGVGVGVQPQMWAAPSASPASGGGDRLSGTPASLSSPSGRPWQALSAVPEAQEEGTFTTSQESEPEEASFSPSQSPAAAAILGNEAAAILGKEALSTDGGRENGGGATATGRDRAGAKAGAKGGKARTGTGTGGEFLPELPPDELYDEFGQLLGPWRLLTSPLVTGEENLRKVEELMAEEKRGVLFVGNHTIYGIYDTPVLLHELYLRNFRVRGLSHPGHWLSGLGSVMERYGHVRASPLMAYKLLKNKDAVLLFPGGAREVCKRRSERYTLQWGPQPEFVRMAARLDALVVPFSLVGADDAFDVMLDPEEVLALPLLGSFLRGVYEQNNLSTDTDVYPLTRFPGTPLPSPIPVPASIERIYIKFCEPIDTRDLAPAGRSSEAWAAAYALVQERVLRGIQDLQELRASDPERDLGPRLMAKLYNLLPNSEK